MRADTREDLEGPVLRRGGLPAYERHDRRDRARRSNAVAGAIERVREGGVRPEEKAVLAHAVLERVVDELALPGPDQRPGDLEHWNSLPVPESPSPSRLTARLRASRRVHVEYGERRDYSLGQERSATRVEHQHSRDKHLRILVPGASEARCIDARRLEACGATAISAAVAGNRPDCECFQSKDIGEYNTCPHGCVYCYAVQSRSLSQERFRRHNPDSEFLFEPPPGAREEQPALKPLQGALSLPVLK